MGSASATTAIKPGQFCWVEAATSDVAASKVFYGSLFGWTYKQDGEGWMEYIHLQCDGVEFGGLHALMPEQIAQQIPSNWLPYVKVGSIAETTARVRKAGGEVVVESCEIPDTGRLAVYSDPTGAKFAVWESLGREGAAASPDSGRPSWFELMSTDRTKALAFYSSVLGWTTSDMDMGPMEVYTLLHNGDEDPIGGSMQLGAEFEGMPSQWSLYFTVSDCDASAAKAQELGGQLCHGPMDVPGIGRFALMADPTGAMFAIIAYASEA